MKTTLVSATVLCVLSACGPRTESPAPPSGSPPAPASTASTAPSAQGAQRYTIDDSKLQQVNRFKKDDLDPAKSACSDFLGYANGKWVAQNEIPADRTTWGAFEMLIERATGIQRQIAEQAAAAPGAAGVDKIVGDLYATGMDEAAIEAQGIKPLEGRLAEIDAIKDRAQIAEYLRKAASRGEGLVFGFGPEPDFARPDMMMGYVVQGGLGLPDKSYYFAADKKPKLAAYQKHVARVLELSGVPASDAAKGAEKVVAFETRLAKVSKSSEELARDVSLYYNPVTPAEADKLTPQFPWTRFFEAQGIAVPEKFSLAIPGFHKEVNALIGSAPIDDWKTYLRFHVVDSMSPYLSSAFAQENFEFYSKTMRGQKEMKARYKRVLDTIDEQAGQAFGQLYVAVAFPPEAKARMEKLVGNLRDALHERLTKLPWMSEETKTKAMAKWSAFRAKIGYPDKWRDWSGLTTSRDSYVANFLAANQFNYRYELGKIGKPVDKEEWGLDPQTVNANYNPLRNEVTFPAAILQPPFFDPTADDAVNYGGIGAVIGHEMTHGYDDQGSRFGPSGKFENWWTPDDAKGFSALTGRLVEQFDAYAVAPGKKVNGKLTLGENIADLGGLAVAYDAMRRATAGKPDPKTEGMTRDQWFFANWAAVWRRRYTADELDLRLVTDPHAPSNFRAIGAPSNMEAFAEAFACKPGDPMVRDGASRITIW
jgi:putative endopeptidase